MAGAPPPAAAFELFGFTFFGRDEPADDVIGTPQPYTLDFAVTGPQEVEDALKAASSLWADRDEPASGAAGLIAKARGDYRRLLDALYSEARYAGTISITIDGRQATELAPDAVLADPALVRVVVTAGPLFRFQTARVVNAPPPAVDPDDVVDDPAAEGFRSGAEARSGAIVRAGRLAVEGWRQQGHAKAEVAGRDVTADHRDDTVDAVVTVAPGRRAVYGPVSVRGTERMDPGFVAYMTGLQPGVEYDPDSMQKAANRLARLDVFRAARLVEADEIGADGTLPITVVVQERLPRRFGVGGTFSTVDGLGLEAYWLHRNLFGRAERLRVEGRVGGIGKTFDPTAFTYRLGAIFTKPGIYTPDTDFVASVFGEREVLESYTRTGVTGEAGFKHDFNDALSGRLMATGGYARFEDDLGTREFTTAGLSGALTFDSRDDPADATQGFFVEAVAEPFYEFNYGNAILRGTIEGRTYYGFGEDDRVVAAGRLKFGTLYGAPTAETPPDKLFFAGGGGSVRGYAYRNIGVPVPGGVVGGHSLIEGSAELRVRVTDTIGVVGFADAGYVGDDPIPDFSQDLRVGVGGGVRYLTGLGPIRLDVAVPLDRRPGDPSVAFYAGIGQAF
ncbi:autotransporter assembly complex protein TamA [Aquibium sp. A9E412]|nr:autotransporter assembly complex family protein [Aquibium sp. A9E412]MDN2566103.1 autotransporter assembly complex protein TamA [Aquibium sp. A9E412]